jgi:hypothetical protein
MATSALSQKEFIGRESFATSIPCSRCQGLMVVEQGFDSLTGAGPAVVPIRRCVQCGEVVDPVILQNRRLRDKADLRRTSE